MAEPTTPAPETAQDLPAAPVAPATVQKEIPLLTEKDIECRVQSVSRAKTGKVGAVLLLYKDARVDIATIQESAAADLGEQDRLEQIQAIISERENHRMEYDDSIVRQMIECIKVYPGGKLEIIFGGGYLVEETV